MTYFGAGNAGPTAVPLIQKGYEIAQARTRLRIRRTSADYGISGPMISAGSSIRLCACPLFVPFPRGYASLPFPAARRFPMVAKATRLAWASRRDYVLCAERPRGELSLAIAR